MLHLEEENRAPAAIKVVGVGGAGMNAVNRMIAADLRSVEFVIVNTDEQALKLSRANNDITIGQKTTRGMGAGGDPELGLQAALEDRERLNQTLRGSDMIFVTAGMGGGTGTGAAPVVAELSREMGALVVGVVTLPFTMEGGRRMGIAEAGLALLREKVDTLITIHNDSIFKVIDPSTSVDVAFRLVDDVLLNAVRGISDLINTAGLVNVDFADVRSIMGETGDAVMGAGEGIGENRAAEAVKQAIHNSLLEETSIEGATALLINVCGGEDLSIVEWKEVAELITRYADIDANIIIGLTIDRSLQERLRVTVIATGFGKRRQAGRAEQARAGQSRPEQIRAGQSRAEKNGSKELRELDALGLERGLERNSTFPAHRELSQREAAGLSYYRKAGQGAKEAPKSANRGQRRASSERGGLDPNDLDIPAFLRRNAAPIAPAERSYGPAPDQAL